MKATAYAHRAVFALSHHASAEETIATHHTGVEIWETRPPMETTARRMSHGLATWTLNGVTRSNTVAGVHPNAAIHGAGARTGEMSQRMVVVVSRKLI